METHRIDIDFQKGDTLGTIYQRARGLEQAFLAAHQERHGAAWTGHIIIAVHVPADLWPAFQMIAPTEPQAAPFGWREVWGVQIPKAGHPDRLWEL
jgi:hypothetical protein